MAGENEGGAGGEAQGQQQQGEQAPGAGGAGSAPPPSMADIAASLQAMQQQFAQVGATQQQMAQWVSAQQQAAAQQQAGQRQQEQGYIDPEIQKLLMQQKQELGGEVDRLAFQLSTRDAGVDAKMAEEAEAMYQAWCQKGVFAQGIVPSRIDALRFVRGKYAEAGVVNERATQAQKLEEARRNGNLDATLERPGHVQRHANLPDPSKLSIDQRREVFWPKKLNDEEGW